MTKNMLTRLPIICAVLALASCSRHGPYAETPLAQTRSSTAVASPDGMRLVFDEEFNSGSLDRSRWNVEGPTFWVNNEQQAYIDSSKTIAFGTPDGADGGALILRPQYEPGYTTPSGRKADFVSGRINTSGKFALTYGKITARIRMPADAGVWPAFWMLGYGQWPDCGELDIMEYVGEPKWTSAAMHGPGYFGDTPLVKRQTFPEGVDVTQWHEYSLERTPDTVIFSVDGREFYRVTKAMVEKYGPWRFDRPEYVILNFAVGGVYPHKVNGIEKPYFGLPQSTVDRIKAGKIAMEVDWVRAWERN